MLQPRSLDIVLPCYKPSGAWTEEILQAGQALAGMLPGVRLRLILVNDGSGEYVTAAHLRQLEAGLPQFLYIENPVNMGKGFTLRRGVEASDAELCIFTDVDFPYTLESVMAIYGMLRSGTDIAIGIKDADYYRKLPPVRVRISRFLRWLSGVFLRISITDTQCGLKGFNARGKAVFLRTTINRYLADLEFIFLADREKGLSMKPVTVHLREHVVFSRINPKILLTEGRNFMKVWAKATFGWK